MSAIYTYRSAEFLPMPAAEVVGDPHIANPGPQMWFNAAAFRVLPAFTLRTNPYKYYDITGPIMWNIGATVAIRERYEIEFRLEAYNATNSLMWPTPTLILGNALFGRSTQQAQGNRTARFSTLSGCSSDPPA